VIYQWIKLSSKNDKTAILFRIGSIGYVAGFLAWFTWFLLVLLNLIAYQFGYGYSGVISGIFFQSGPYALIVSGLFSASFILGSFASFGLKRRYGSNIALICGIFYLTVFAILCYSLANTYSLQVYIPTLTNLLMFLNLGMLVWGATLLEVRKSLPYPRLSSWMGYIFILIPILTLALFWQVFLYWGIEMWFMLFGWLYAIGAVVTAIILYRLSK
jgi:hypothetical protein